MADTVDSTSGCRLSASATTPPSLKSINQLIDQDVEEQVVEVYVSRLRKKLKPFDITIKMQRGLGYTLQAEP